MPRKTLSVLILLGVAALVCFLADFARQRDMSARKPLLPQQAGPGPLAELLAAQDDRTRWVEYLDEDGEVKPPSVILAHRQRTANLRILSLNSIGGLSRDAWKYRGPHDTAGRTRALLVHPDDPRILWAAADTGGIWKSLDRGRTWRPINDFLPSLAVLSMALDPDDPNILYAGTGLGFVATGILKSIDGGETWLQIPTTNSWKIVWSISIATKNSALILAATSSGVYRSSDHGEKWELVLTGWARDVEFSPADDDRAIASIRHFDPDSNKTAYSVFYSTDGGSTWVESFGLGGMGKDRIELTYAVSNPEIVYANVADSDACWGCGGSVWRSEDGGQSFAMKTLKIESCEHPCSTETTSNWFTNTIWVSPTDSDFILVGGVELFRSEDGGVHLENLSRGSGLDPESKNLFIAMWVDQHWIVEDTGFRSGASSSVYICNDGGIFRAENVFEVHLDSERRILRGMESLNKGYASTQFYAARGVFQSGFIAGGTQDRGIVVEDPKREDRELVRSGDGGHIALDPIDEDIFYGEIQYMDLHRFTERGDRNFPIARHVPDVSAARANFIAPFALDENEPNRMFAGGASLWRSDDVRLGNPPSWVEVKSPDRLADPESLGYISALAVGPPGVVWVGQNDGKLFSTENAWDDAPEWRTLDNNSELDPLPDRTITRILISDFDPRRVYIALGGFSEGNLMRTNDGGSSWEVITGDNPTGLPGAPVFAVAEHPTIDGWLYVGTELGLFASKDQGLHWSTSNEGPANVRVSDLSFMRDSTTLLAATYGRGLWTVDTPRLLARRLR